MENFGRPLTSLNRCLIGPLKPATRRKIMSYCACFSISKKFHFEINIPKYIYNERYKIQIREYKTKMPNYNSLMSALLRWPMLKKPNGYKSLTKTRSKGSEFCEIESLVIREIGVAASVLRGVHSFFVSFHLSVAMGS